MIKSKSHDFVGICHSSPAPASGRSNKKVPGFILSLFLISFLTACGQKGPLYLPGDKDQPKRAQKHDFPIH